MRRLALALGMLAVLLAGCSVQVGPIGTGCSHTATFSRNVSAEEVTALDLTGRSGKLVLRGREGAAEVLVEGRACASQANLLQQMGLEAEKTGATVRVNSIQPNIITNGSAWMDLTVEVPPHLIARVEKSSGQVIIQDVAGLDLEKGSGDLEVVQIGGDVRVTTSSGTVRITDVAGDTTYEGGSGNLTMRDLKGAVLIREKSSGTVQIAGVGKGLTAERIGSGDLTVRKVNGPIELRSKSSGTVTITDVNEKVQLGSIGSGNLTVKTVGALSVDEKSSGTLEISQIRQAVTLGRVGSGNLRANSVGSINLLDKSSGTVEIDGVTGSVQLGSIGSGYLDVRNVHGDLIVKQKSSGDVTHSAIQGRVELPRR